MSWSQIEQKAPKLHGLRELFKYVPMSSDERSDYEKFNKKVNDKTYAAFSLQEKFKYIQFGHNLSVKQQAITPDELIGTYAKRNAAAISKQTYARLRPGDQRKVQEAILAFSPGKITDFAIMLGTGRLPEQHEARILKNAVGATKYAEVILNGRWPELEAKLLKTTAWAAIIDYAKRLIQGRWPEAERRFVKMAEKETWALGSFVTYAEEVAKERIPEIEKMILRDLQAAPDSGEQAQKSGSESWHRRIAASSSAVDYAVKVIKGRWPEYEEALRHLPNFKAHREYYAKLLRVDPAELAPA